MSGKALSEEAMLASLRGIDLPAEAAGGLAADLAMTVALAGLAALLVSAVLRLFSQRALTRAEDSIRMHLAQARALPEPERRVRLLHLLRQRAPARYAEVARDLYHPDGALTAAEVEAELVRLV